MVDIVIPRALAHARNSFRYIDQTGASRGAYTGVVQTTGYGGDRVGATIDFTQHGGGSSTARRHRAQLQAFLMSLKGKQNRVYITDESYTPGGSFPATELFTNSDFSNGTTSWLSDSKWSLSAADGVLRSTANTSSGTGFPAYQSVAQTQFAPYVIRIVARTGRGSSLSIYPLLDNFAVSPISSALGYASYSSVVQNASAPAGMTDATAVGMLAGDFFETLFISCARCLLTDGGGNALVHSDSLSTSPWAVSTGVTISAPGVTAPDGATDGQNFVEDDAVNREHYTLQAVTVTAAVADYTLSVSAQAVNRSWVLLRVFESLGSTYSYAWFNLSTGVVGTTTTGANLTNLRTHVVNQGNGWYRCSLTFRKSNAAVGLTAVLQSATADGVLFYTGVAATSALYLWEPSLNAGGVPTRGTGTTTVAIASASQPGSSIYVKGLPVSTSGLLLAGDWVEIDGQLKMVVASMNSDAAGLGYLQFSPPLRRSVADNTPIIVHRPMGRFMYAGDSVGWDNEPGVFSRSTIELEEAYS